MKVKVGRGKVGRAKEGRAKGKQEEQALRRVGGLGLSLQCWTLSPFLAVHSLHCSDTGSVQSLSIVLILAKLRGLQISFGLIKIMWHLKLPLNMEKTSPNPLIQALL